MAIDWTVFLIGVPAVIFAGISKGGFGSGASFLAGAILALVIDPATALGIMLPVLMLMDATSLRPYWRKWDPGAARWMILGGVPGVALGAWFFTLVSIDVIRFLIGLVCLLFLAWTFWPKRGLERAGMGERWGLAFGAAAGFTSFVSHAGGPAAIIYLLSRKLDKTTYQATTVLVFAVLNVAKAVPYVALGFFSPETLLMGALLAPAALLGVWLGVVAHYAIPERVFFALTYVLLAVTGSRLIWVAVT